MKASRAWLMGLAGLALGGMAVRRLLRPRGTDLQGAVVLITGGSRGLGLQLARTFADHGARIALTARDPVTLARAHDELSSRGVEVVAISADLTQGEEIRDLVRRVRTELGPVDVLVNNAGRIEIGPFGTMTEADHAAGLELHYWAPLRLIEAVLPDMKARGRGHIVNITSIGGRMAVPHMLPYTASKHALVGLSRGLRTELRRFGITVTTVVPGLMNTGSPRNALFKGHHRQEYAWFALADSAPILSVGATRAARRIVRAVRRGDTELVIGAPARLALWASDLFPRVTYGVMGQVERWVLPEPSEDRRAHRGHESTSELTERLWPRRGERAVRRLNQEVP